MIGIGISIFLIGCSSPLPIKNNGILANQSEKTITSGQLLPISAKARIPARTIKLEVTKTEKQQNTGLMYRTSLSNNTGMLFEFKPARKVNFWMKNCKISLDMIFLRDGVVEAIELSAAPCTADPCPTYESGTAVDRVIELRGGRASELGVQVGDRVEIEFLPAN